MPFVYERTIFRSANDTVREKLIEGTDDAITKTVDLRVRHQGIVGRDTDLARHGHLAMGDSQRRIADVIVFSND